ncbi:unnamed protein product [Diatraea saccharalis]|uniref:Uncharacterized protein n=1 Tax=Diatraea saccharalis TaxID=40085 RepID=A0A9N9R123_9NEOP|nr:unnamed protein product [Diatraea saccharalis]
MLDVELACWYIVADSNTLLEHFNFINVIVNSDEQCQLMVPDDTMAALQTASRSEDSKRMSRAHLVLRLLSQQLTTGGAVMGKYSTKSSENYSILDFTLNLAEQNHNVVLLCNSIESKEINYSDIIPVFTIQEIKEILENRTNPTKPKAEVIDTGRIKITIPNINPDYEISSCVTEKPIDLDTDKVNPPKSNSNLNTGKTTLEMGVQTEFECGIDKNKETVHTDSIVHNSVDNKFVEFNDSNCQSTEFNSNTVNNQPKKREIRLKRNISQQSSSVSENNTMKKQFKWRRRKKEVSEPPLESKQTKRNDICTANTDTSQRHPDISADTEDVLFEGDQTNENKQTPNKDPCGDNYSDTTSGSCFIYKDASKTTIIEETSTSGVISNTASIVDSESLYSIKENNSTYISNNNGDQRSNKCFMFEVENSVMEEHLKMKSDEWLSRFVQIMEDILTQVLCLDPPYDHPSLRPPWNLHEASECIKRKFNTDARINDAASKLSNVLYRNSDDRGIIDIQLKPTSFMEIYSYGVYLVDCLKAVLSNFEDLKTAAESLAKLLEDIQSTNNSNNDSFTDNSNDPSANDTQCSSANSTEKGICCNNDTKKSTRNNLESKSIADIDDCDGIIDFGSNQTQNDAEIGAVQHVKFVRKIDIESTFFSSLHLQRKEGDIGSRASAKSLAEVIESNPDDVVPNKDVPEPKIIRKFNKCLEFEERLKNKQRELLDLDSLDYRDDKLEEFCYDEEYNSVYDNYMNDENEDLSEMKSDYQTDETQDINNEATYNSKWIIGKTMNEVQQALAQMHAFCDNTRGELNSSQPLSPMRKLKIQEQAENARVHLTNLFQSLSSIMEREDKEECDTNILNIFNEIGIFLDPSQAAEYRKIIGNSIEQTYILLESVNIVLEAVK